MTPSELYATQLQNPEPGYYSRVPHILDHLTYDQKDEETGEVKVKRLSVYAKELYRILKMIAGDFGACWMNRDKLAEIANMSAGSISMAKEELKKNFHQLEGKPLIIITECPKMTVKDNIKINKTMYHKIMIVDIWRYNNAYMSIKNNFKDLQAPSLYDSAGGAPSYSDAASQGAPSYSDTNKNKQKENSLFKEQQPVDDPTPVCFSETENPSVFSNNPIPCEKKAKAFNWFVKIGCDFRSATYLVETYSLDDIKLGSLYVEKQLEKKKKKNEYIPNIVGYLRKTLENKWWIPNQKGI